MHPSLLARIVVVVVVCCNQAAETSSFVPSHSATLRTTNTLLFLKSQPPPPPFVPKPLPVLLGGGLFLFGSSVKPRDRAFADKLLELAQSTLRADPIVTMELGQSVETGGVYSSMKKSLEGVDQLVLQFQIEGGNAWAQGVAYGIQDVTTGSVQLVSLEVANMDASMKGTPLEVAIPKVENIEAEGES